MQRLPIYKDDKNLTQRGDQMFRDMQSQMDQDFMGGFGRPFRSMQPPSWFKTGDNFPGEADFFSLRPHPSPSFSPTPLDHMPLTPNMQMEVLDPNTTNSLFVEDPVSKSRMFQMIFDVKDYDPQAIQVRVESGCLVVEAKQNEIKNGGTKLNKEFCRKIQLPADVDPEKLSSTLSAEGVLCVKAPVPPKYNAIPSSPQQHFNTLPNSPQPHFNTLSSSPQPHFQQIHHQQQQQQLPHFQQSQQPLFTTTFRSSPVYQTSNQFSPPPKTSSGYTVPVISVENTLTNVRDRPVFTTASDMARKRMDLVLDLGRQYNAENIVVKFDDRSKQLTVEAVKEDRDNSGKISRSQTQKQFELGEAIDPASIQAVMRNDGSLHVSALTCLR